MDSATLIAWVLENLNYWVVAAFMAIESSFIPFPSEVVVPPAAWLSMSDPSMNIVLVVVFATLGADVGALVNYFLARWLGRPVIYKFARSRWGHFCLVTEESVARAEDYFRDHGATATFFGRLVPAVRQLISIPAGLSGMKLGPFLLYTTLGAGAWNTVLALIGYFISRIPGVQTKEQVVKLAMRYSHELGYVLFGLAALFLAYLIYNGLKKTDIREKIMKSVDEMEKEEEEN